MRQHVQFLRGGLTVTVEGFDPATTLLDYIRLAERSTGTKEGCAEGDCGACTVVVGRRAGDGVAYTPVNSCIRLLGQIDGCELVTVEDLSTRSGGLHPVQAAMVEHHGSQCGFCTPGFVMSLFALYHAGGEPDRVAVNQWLAGNLCRCTGYRPIVDAALAACSGPRNDAFVAQSVRTAASLADLDDGRDVFVGTADRFFAAPATVESLASIYEANPDALLVAGATDVGLWITKGLQRPAKIIHLGRVAGLDALIEGDTALTIGAACTYAQGEAALSRIDPDIADLLWRIGGKQVRAVGTIGGNIANGSPIGDMPPVLIALGATLTLRKGERLRTIPLEEFFLAYRRQDREPGEFVLSVTVPKPEANQVFRCYKVSKRFDQDISAVLGAFRFSVEDGHVTAARAVYGGMAGTPKRALLTERLLRGLSLADRTKWGEAIDALEKDFSPLSDHRASAGYRMSVAKALLAKALTEARGGDPAATRVTFSREMVLERLPP